MLQKWCCDVSNVVALGVNVEKGCMLKLLLKSLIDIRHISLGVETAMLHIFSCFFLWGNSEQIWAGLWLL